MKKSTVFLATALAALIGFSACSDTPKGDKAIIASEQQVATAAGQVFTIDTTASRIRFTGNGVGKNHPGMFRLSSGSVAAANNQITSGQFIIDIKSMDLEQKE